MKKTPETFFVKEIIITLDEPKVCPKCEKDGYFIKNLVFEKISRGNSYLCTKCEALTIVTNLNLKKVELETEEGITVMLKDNYLIRKII